MYGPMKEAQENRTRLDDVDKSTFAQFAQFIYWGDYNADEGVVVLDDTVIESEESREEIESHEAVTISGSPPPFQPESEAYDGPRAADDDWFTPASKQKRHRGRKMPIQLQLPRLASFAAFPLPAKDVVSIFKLHEVYTVNDAAFDYTEVRCHVRLYAFAERYQITSLKNLVLRKLHKTLTDTNFHPQRGGELVGLLDLVYESTLGLLSRDEPLRTLLTLYVAWHFEELAPLKEFQCFLEAGGTCVNDVCQKVSQRL